MLRPLYQLLEEFPSLREKTLDKIRQIEWAQEEARRVEAFPLRPIFPPPLRVIYPKPAEPVEQEDTPLEPTPMSESESSTSEPMSVDSFQEAMDYSIMMDQSPNQAEVSNHASSNKSSSTLHSSSDVEIVGPSVDIPPIFDDIPLSAATGAKFAQRLPDGAPTPAQADVPQDKDDDGSKRDVDTSEATEIERTVSEIDLQAFRHLHSIGPSIKLRRPLRDERTFGGRDGEICLYE